MAVSPASDLLTSGRLCSSFQKAGQEKYLFVTNPSIRVKKFGRRHFNGQLSISSYNLCISAQYESRRGSGAGDLFAGFVLGGVLFGALGYLLAPQASKSLFGSLRENDWLSENLSKNADDDEGIEKTRSNLNEKIAQLNSAIDEVSAQLRADNGFAYLDGSTPELESAA